MPVGSPGGGSTAPTNLVIGEAVARRELELAHRDAPVNSARSCTSQPLASSSRSIVHAGLGFRCGHGAPVLAPYYVRTIKAVR